MAGIISPPRSIGQHALTHEKAEQSGESLFVNETCSARLARLVCRSAFKAEAMLACKNSGDRAHPAEEVWAIGSNGGGELRLAVVDSTFQLVPSLKVLGKLVIDRDDVLYKAGR